MSDPSTPVGLAPYKDRKIGLIAFGVILALIGGFLLLGTAMSVVLRFGSIGSAAPQPPPSALIVMLWGNLFLVTALVWVGVGSMLRQKWVRPIVLCVSAFVMAGGLLELAFMPWILGQTLRQSMERNASDGPALPDAAVTIALWTALSMTAILVVGLPALFLWFYRKRDVRLTLEAHDSRPRWTDNKPIALVAAILAISASGIYLLPLPLQPHFLLFGFQFGGFIGRLCWTVPIAISYYAAKGFLRQDRNAWAAYLVFTVLMGISSWVSWLRLGYRGVMDSYGFGAQPSLAAIEQHQGALLALAGAVLLVWLGFLLYVGRYFPAPAAGRANAT